MADDATAAYELGSNSVFRSNLPLADKLEKAREELLDLGARNRLLNIPRTAKSAKTLEIVDEVSSEVFRMLAREGKAFTFLAGKAAPGTKIAEDGEDDEIAELAQPDSDSVDSRGIFLRHADTKLQTRLTPAGLQKRLLDLHNDARTLEEEQGVNILFLALGTLKWIDPNNAANIRYAPLILAPVALERGNAAEKFKLRARAEDVAANLSLEAYLLRVHGLKLPTFEAADDFDPSAYARDVADAVSAKPGWEVLVDDIVLGFFSFAKFLMYRDLDPKVWPSGAKLDAHALIKPLVSDGFDESEPLLPEDEPIDAHIAPADMVHIVDSDSSQTLAVHEVRSGRNLVIQGPPGTGKSQTIANIIAAAVADGRTVLFVAEKMAALEVVKRRLDATDVGAACLELHSNKANKRAVLQELERTWQLGAPRGPDATTVSARLEEARDQLNAHAERLHTPIGAAGRTPYEVIGHLTRLKAAGEKPSDLALEGIAEWSAQALNERMELISDLAVRITALGQPSQHPWRGVEPPSALPHEIDRLTGRLAELHERLEGLRRAQDEIVGTLELADWSTLADLDGSLALANRIAGAPDLPPTALGTEVWDRHGDAIAALLRAGVRHTELSFDLADVFRAEAWKANLAELLNTLAPLPTDFPFAGFGRSAEVADVVPNLLEEAQRLAIALGRKDAPRNLEGLETLAAVGERVAVSPDVDPQAFTAESWDKGVERAGDLATAVKVLETARADIASELSEAAWITDLAGARRTLAAYGSGILRFLSSEWRSADRLVRSFLADPKTRLARRLNLLDALARGQAAAAAIREDAEFGRNAFMGDWRGERSSSVPLLTLVEWMRSLKGLGVEPRVVASRSPDRRLIGELARQVAALAARLRKPLADIWNDLDAARVLVFADAPEAYKADLVDAALAAARLHDAEQAASALTLKAEPDLEVRRHQLSALAESQGAKAKIEASEALGVAAFGDCWTGTRSDWTVLATAADWIAANLGIHALASRIEDRVGLAARAAALLNDRNALLSDLHRNLADLNAGTSAAITAEDALNGPVVAFAERLTEWRDGGEALTQWSDYRARVRQAEASGLSDLVQQMNAGVLPPSRALSAFEQAVFESVFGTQAKTIPDLIRFDGELQDRLVSRFVDLDRERIRHAALEVLKRHHASIPSRRGALGPVGVLKGEIARKRGHMPIRKLMEQAAPAVQAIKPVFMMSPLSVAQYLPPGALTFDLLVMDEASQIQPVDALGAIARCRQVVVVGDPQQLPPTTFFAKMTGAADDDDDGAAKVADVESILGLFTARGLPMRMLRWHYRSRHQSLIAVSNRQFYEDKLYIVPSPYTAQAGLGLRFHHVTDGVFETGTTRTNPLEARAVARAIIDHALHHADQSLGVVAFSAAQRRAIQDQVELLRRSLGPENEAFFQAHPSEPFFIKNLENVQGDERDVIMISVGYGPAATGAKPPMRFGPLGSEGGERRLNVLISRAKLRCEVFASMTDEDIEADFARTRKGVFAFKIFLHFARTGRMALADSTGRDRLEVFEEQVAQAMHKQGWVVHRNVGVSGIFIPVAVADPERPERYLLAVECDGAAYHDAKSARDRDRLRRSVLEDHGWFVHRIWSADWFRRPNDQLARVVAAANAAKAEAAAHDAGRARPRPVTYELQAVERDDVTEIGLVAIEEAPFAITPYEEAVLTRPKHLLCALHDAPTGALSTLAERVVAIEGPVHVDEIVARIREAWELKRAGARIHDAVNRALAVSVRMGRLVTDDTFYSEPGRRPVVRDRGSARSLTLRRPEALPPAEIAAALIDVLGRNFGATQEQAVQAVSRSMGFKATSSQVRDVIDNVLRAQVDAGVLKVRGELIELGPNAPATERAASAPSPLEKLIAQGEDETLEFKETLRWDIRQNAVNKKLADSSLKAIAAFANHRGGTLLVGVKDDGTVPGLGPDLESFGGSRDKFELHLTELIKDRFSESFRAGCVSTSYPIIDDKIVCRVDVRRSRVPVYLAIADGNGAATERLIVRAGASSPEIPLSQVAAFVREHFER